ncbi:MAG: 50S ribosomal protein L11 methyltransferase [Actinomycetota bacterium]|nr:50S ribosomal protein L11 methyltransferase [Actinomycetota bacterium]
MRRRFADVEADLVEPGWEDRWRDFHRPVSVGPLWVGPAWESPPPDAVAVSIDPGRAFGTGAHPTTQLCLELLLGLDRRSLLDVGCGSGVLAIAAAKLGFHPVCAVDREVAAAEATRDNVRRNGVDVTVELADALTADLPAADAVVANIDLVSIEALAPRLEARALITAGYFHSRVPRAAGFRHVERRVDGGWAADRWVRE